MRRSSSSISGRALLFLVLAALVILAVYDLSAPNSFLQSIWDSFFPGRAPVEGVRDNVVDRLGIPR